MVEEKKNKEGEGEWWVVTGMVARVVMDCGGGGDRERIFLKRKIRAFFMPRSSVQSTTFSLGVKMKCLDKFKSPHMCLDFGLFIF